MHRVMEMGDLISDHAEEVHVMRYLMNDSRPDQRVKDLSRRGWCAETHNHECVGKYPYFLMTC